MNLQQQQSRGDCYNYYYYHDYNYYEWIEQILKTPFQDCRKIILRLVLAPYLLNIKKLSYRDSYQIIQKWLDKCDSLEKLDSTSNFDYRISYALKSAMKIGFGPMSLDKMRTGSNYTKLHQLLIKKEIIKK